VTFDVRNIAHAGVAMQTSTPSKAKASTSSASAVPWQAKPFLLMPRAPSIITDIV